MINFRSATPDKSVVTTSISRRGITHKIKFINRKGTFKYSPTCDKCAHQGKVQDEYGILSPTCDRDGDTWRSQGRIIHLTPQECKFFKYICPHGYTDTDQCPDCCH